MALGIRTLADRLFQRRMLRLWARAARQAETLDLGALKGLRGRARQVRRRIDQVLFTADERLTLPLIGSSAIPRPLHSDWAYRPEIWRGPVSPPGIAAAESRATLGGETTIHHDCTISELTARQVRNTRESDIAPFGLRLDVFRFDGSFLSLAIDLPPDAAQGLEKRHLIRLAAIIEVEKPLEIFARLNVRHGPNTEQIVRELPMGKEEAAVDFDLAYSRLNERRVEKLWVDLIFEGPEMNQVIIRDLTLTRRPRSDF